MKSVPELSSIASYTPSHIPHPRRPPSTPGAWKALYAGGDFLLKKKVLGRQLEFFSVRGTVVQSKVGNPWTRSRKDWVIKDINDDHLVTVLQIFKPQWAKERQRQRVCHRGRLGWRAGWKLGTWVVRSVHWYWSIVSLQPSHEQLCSCVSYSDSITEKEKDGCRVP